MTESDDYNDNVESFLKNNGELLNNVCLKNDESEEEEEKIENNENKMKFEQVIIDQGIFWSNHNDKKMKN